MIKFSVLSSGSKANCTYIEAGGSRFLIDNGLSAKQCEYRLTSIGVDPTSIDGILVTHEHSDHINGIPTLSRRFKIPVYANLGAIDAVEGSYAVEQFYTSQSFHIGHSQVTPFSIAHDAVDPVAFVISVEGIKLGHCTDLGRVTPLVRHSLSGCNALVLESNHDEDMLRDCGYPWELKQRIASSHGHLSNASSSELLSELLTDNLTHIVLAHLSENSNTPDLALSTLINKIGVQDNKREVLCAGIAKPTPLFIVDGEFEQTIALAV